MKLCCPFTWNLENVLYDQYSLLDPKFNMFDSIAEQEDVFPEFLLVYHLLLANENVLSNEVPTAMECVENAERSFADIEEKKTLTSVENVLGHILKGTKYYILNKLGQMTEAQDLLEKIQPIEDMNPTELAMLNGCQCLAWSVYSKIDSSEAIKCARKVIDYEPGNGKWHFLLGKSIRDFRRNHLHHMAGRHIVTEEEETAFRTPYEISQNAWFGSSLAQMYRESGNDSKANEMYVQVYELEPTACRIKLELALGFIRSRKCTLAKRCLDYVAEKKSGFYAHAHYMGIYEEKCNKDFMAALPHYTLARESTNYAAEWQYINCKNKVEPDWDHLQYILELPKKYEKSDNLNKESINIEIGCYYIFRLDDVLTACQYLVEVIDLQEHVQRLKVRSELECCSSELHIKLTANDPF